MSDTYIKKLSCELGFNDDFLNIDEHFPEIKDIGIQECKPNEYDDMKNNLACCEAYKVTNVNVDRYAIDYLKTIINEDMLANIEDLKTIKTKHALNYSIGFIQGAIVMLGSASLITSQNEKLLNKLAYETFINCGNKLNQLEQKGCTHD